MGPGVGTVGVCNAELAALLPEGYGGARAGPL